jgi:hypothetical protein
LWLFACGTQFCHALVNSNVFAFGNEQNAHTWPLQRGIHQTHLVKRKEDCSFGSAAVSSVFTVEEESVSAAVARTLMGPEVCLDAINTQSFCYEEGDAVYVAVTSECTPLTENAEWIGFYNEEPNKDSNDVFFGDPILWTRACYGDDCNGASTKFNFKAEQKEADDSSVLLPTGSYRAILVGAGYRHGGPYNARIVSDPFEVHTPGEPCPTKTTDTAY